MKIRLFKTITAWGTPGFESVLREEVEQLDAKQLPLQQGLSTSSYALDNKVKARIISASGSTSFIYAKIGIFYTGIIAGCSCADDPTPINENNEYCEAQLEINKITAETTVTLLAE